MKLSFTLLLMLAGLVSLSVANAQEKPAPGRGREAARQGGPGRLSEEQIKKYDKDADGKLSEDEMKAMRTDREKEMLAKYDANKDGKLDEEERKKMQADNPRMQGFQPDPETLKKYDKNGDGKLDEEERKAWRETREKEMLEKYDADKDGKMSDDERRKAFEDMRKLRESKAGDGAKKPEEIKKAEPVKPDVAK